MLTPLSVIAVRRYSGWLAASHFYFELTDGASHPYPRQELLKMSKTSQRGRDLLEWAAVLTDVAVAQQVLEQGGLLVPLAWRAWMAESDEELICRDWAGANLLANRSSLCNIDNDKVTAAGTKYASDLRALLFGTKEMEERKDPEAGGLLRANPLFARNLVRYGVRQTLESKKSNALAYQVAVGSPDGTELIHKLLGPKWSPKFNTKNDAQSGLKVGWSITIHGTPIMLPSADDVWKGSVALQPGYIGLLDARRRVSEELAGYRFVSTATTAELSNLKRLLRSGFSF
jgi:hypothetical protein